jgi:activator of HSP90 ATPase
MALSEYMFLIIFSERVLIAGMTRRKLMVGIVGAAASGQEAAARPDTIHRELEFPVNSHRVYEALLDAKQFGDFSGVHAEIHREAGGAFSLFDGQIMGRNVELVPDRRIVQAWRAASWHEGIYSIAKFELAAQGSGTRLIFDHTGFPPSDRDSLSSGWDAHYFGPLKKYFAG